MQPEGPATREPVVEHCYRHPGEETRVHCTRCGKPICPACMIPAPVGHHCPECVGQARREFRQGPGRRVRSVTTFSATNVLLWAILACFVLQIALGGPGALSGGGQSDLVVRFAMQPLFIALRGEYWRLITAMFLHAGVLHIAFNAYALYLFGHEAEGIFGRWRFLLIYFVAGFLASVSSYAFGDPRSLGVGASGAIFGVFGAFIAYNYRRRHQALAAMRLQWAWSIILINAILAFAFRGIDWRAHLGGLIAGFALGGIIDGVGPRHLQPAFRILGVAALIAIGVGAVVWRTQDLRGAFPGLL